jgi:hypothetical protein
MPTLRPAELDELIDEAGPIGWLWGADELAHEIGLDDATRTHLKITTIGAIDCDKRQREQRRKRKRKLDARARRAQAGAKPHVQSAERRMPWIKAGISRRTYYYNRKKRERDCTDCTETKPAILSNSCLDTNQCNEQKNTHKRARSERRSEATIFLSGAKRRKMLGNEGTVFASTASPGQPHQPPTPPLLANRCLALPREQVF